MLPFGFGVLYARYARLDNCYKPCSLCPFIIAILLTSFNYITWYFVPLVICVASITFVRLLSWIEGVVGNGVLLCYECSLVGWQHLSSPFRLSSYHKKIFIPISRGGEYWTGLLLYVISSLCLAWLFKELMKKIPSPKLK